MLNIPGRGIFAFGGIYSSITTSQQLPRIDGSWTYGPNLFQLQNDYGQCAVQVNRDSTNEQDESSGNFCIFHFVLRLS